MNGWVGVGGGRGLVPTCRAHPSRFACPGLINPPPPTNGLRSIPSETSAARAARLVIRRRRRRRRPFRHRPANKHRRERNSPTETRPGANQTVVFLVTEFWLPSFFFFVVLNSVLLLLLLFFFFGGGGFQGGPESTHGRLLRGRVCWWLQLATRLQLAVGTHTHTHTPTRTYTHTHKEAGGKGEDQVKAALNTTGSFSFHRGQLFTIPPDRVAPVVAVVVAVAVVAGRRGSAGGV